MAENHVRGRKDTANGKSGGRKSLLVEYINKKVTVITNDGRNVVGTLLGFDQVCNIVLEKSSERIFAPDAGVQVVNLGLFVVRGDNIAVLAQVDLEKDAQIAWDTTKVSLQFQFEYNKNVHSSASILTIFVCRPCLYIVTAQFVCCFIYKGHPVKRVVH